MWIAVLLGCGPSPEVLDQLAALDVRATAMEERIAKLEEGGSDRDARRAELRARLEARRAQRAGGTTASTPRQLLADPDLSNLGRLLLHRGDDGAFEGYRLSGIRASSVLEQLGFRNGDIVHSIDGKPLTSMEAAMEAYRAVDPTTSSVTLQLTRDGTPTTLTVALDEPLPDLEDE